MLLLKKRYVKGLKKSLYILKLMTVFFSVFNVCYAQQSGNVQYKIFPTGGTFENLDKVKSSSLSGYFKGIDDAIKSLIAELNFSDNKAYYNLLPSMNIEDRINKAARSFAGNGEYFYTKTGEYIHKKSLLGEEFCVKHRSDNDWKLTSESKIISNYICYKATRIRTNNVKGILKKYEVVAWYCPKIPVNFGPIGYGNLPGLILELQEPTKTYCAFKINLESKKIEIKKINCAPISEEEFEMRYKKVLDDHYK
ncbi:GLPGLI family protein [Flavobacterium sp.]|uniref:GLPGLI family protein n=1 Tax=Flavobacterium sp. TaxID=239 RepID=UPI003D15154E